MLLHSPPPAHLAHADAGYSDLEEGESGEERADDSTSDSDVISAEIISRNKVCFAGLLFSSLLVILPLNLFTLDTRK